LHIDVKVSSSMELDRLVMTIPKADKDSNKQVRIQNFLFDDFLNNLQSKKIDVRKTNVKLRILLWSISSICNVRVGKKIPSNLNGHEDKFCYNDVNLLCCDCVTCIHVVFLGRQSFRFLVKIDRFLVKSCRAGARIYYSLCSLILKGHTTNYFRFYSLHKYFVLSRTNYIHMYIRKKTYLSIVTCKQFCTPLFACTYIDFVNLYSDHFFAN
jgi:hypothetical protein